MTDREQDQAEALAEREKALIDRTNDVVRRPVGEEIDPDALRPVPEIDEDRNILDEHELEALREGLM